MWLRNKLAFSFEESQAHSQPCQIKTRRWSGIEEYKGSIPLQDMRPHIFNKHEPEEAQYEAQYEWPALQLPSLHIFSGAISQPGSPSVSQACSLMLNIFYYWVQYLPNSIVSILIKALNISICFVGTPDVLTWHWEDHQRFYCIINISISDRTPTNDYQYEHLRCYISNQHLRLMMACWFWRPAPTRGPRTFLPLTSFKNHYYTLLCTTFIIHYITISHQHHHTSSHLVAG